MSNNCEKKLDALIDALGFDVEAVVRDAVGDEEADIFLLTKDYCVDYKLTKRTYSKKQSLHRIVRSYEKGDITAAKMIRDVMWAEGVTDEEI